MSKTKSVIVIGGGIAGVTASALLANAGIPTTLLEAHQQLGGCAGTFRRGNYIFDVGATQVAGFEKGGIHERIFRYLKYPLPSAEILDPGCLVDLGDGSQPIYLWYEPRKWKEERIRQFPGSESFWTLCDALHQSNWSIAMRDPVLPIRTFWDLINLIKAIRLENLPFGLFSSFSVLDLLKICGCDSDQRLRKFLDMQLKLYSQEPADRTAALYGATVLQMAQAPLGLWHIDGSMQILSDHLASCFVRDSGNLLLRHRVVNLIESSDRKSWVVNAIDPQGNCQQFEAADVICTLPPQCLLEIMSVETGLTQSFFKKLKSLNKPSGAVVLYGAIDRQALPKETPSHLQLLSPSLGSIFISISREGDGRAPQDQATLIASVFVDIDDWHCLKEEEYQFKKTTYLSSIVEEINNYFKFGRQAWTHKELSTPRSFSKWTGRPKGIVGGLGQQPSNFGLFGLPSRTPLRGLWLCGDSIYPGEGTAGVSQSALMACKQLLSNRNGPRIELPS